MQIEQMFLLGFAGCSAFDSPWLGDAINRGLGGVILFDRNVDGSVQNISSPAQLQKLTSTMQSLAEETLLIAVDQEGGQVCRLKERDGFAASESAAILGQGVAEETTSPAVGQMAATLARNGINMNLAPVVDLNLNPDNPIIARYQRSFGGDVRCVVAHARAFIRSHHAHGVACCLKHFPGHGSSRGDSHLGFVDITEDWQRQELEPYKEIFALGFDDAVMTAHVVQRHLDASGVPATLSPLVVHKMLRQELGFTGVTMTDDLQMRAISDRYGLKEAVQLAVLAGVDLLVIGNNLERGGDVLGPGVAAIKELLAQGLVAVSDIQASIQRISILKKRIAGRLPWSDLLQDETPS